MIDLGETVGNYRIMAKLGEGGMGAVYLAEHPVIGRKAALKVIHPQHARNAEVVARFVNEATAISRIGHEHIVEVTDLGRTAAGDLYFIMEYLVGRTLSELVAREAPLPPARALAIAAQIADALAASHAHGVVHRDLKPDNVFLVARGGDAAFVKVLDFGLAKLLDGEGAAAHDTRAGIVMGTPYYMSPEQCRGELDIDARADVYALGVVLFEMLTGRLPFCGDACGEVLLKQVSMRPPAARSLVPDLPETLDVILGRALAKKPAERFPTMSAFRETLVRCAGPRPAARALVDDAPTWQAAVRGPALARLPTTLGHGVGALEDDASFDRLPRHRAGHALALLGAAALGGTMLAARLTRDDAARALAMPTAAVSTASMRREPSAAALVVPVATTDAGMTADAGIPTTPATLETRFQELR